MGMSRERRKKMGNVIGKYGEFSGRSPDWLKGKYMETAWFRTGGAPA